MLKALQYGTIKVVDSLLSARSFPSKEIEFPTLLRLTFHLFTLISSCHRSTNCWIDDQPLISQKTFFASICWRKKYYGAWWRTEDSFKRGLEREAPVALVKQPHLHLAGLCQISSLVITLVLWAQIIESNFQPQFTIMAHIYRRTH